MANLCWQSSPLWGSWCTRPFPPAWPRVIKLFPSSISSQKTPRRPRPLPHHSQPGWERPPVDHCCHCRNDYCSSKSEKKNFLASTEGKKRNCTTKQVQTDLSRKWSSTVNKNYNVSTIRPQLPRHCYLSLLSTSSSTTRTDLLQWSASELSWWSHSWSFCHFSCFVCRHFPLFWDKLFKTYLSGFLTESSQGAVMLLVGFMSESSLEKKNLAEFLQLSVKSCEVRRVCLHTEIMIQKGDVTVVERSWVLAELSSGSRGEFRTSHMDQ